MRMLTDLPIVKWQRERERKRERERDRQRQRDRQVTKHRITVQSRAGE